jgi:hypothetical protein
MASIPSKQPPPIAADPGAAASKVADVEPPRVDPTPKGARVKPTKPAMSGSPQSQPSASPDPLNRGRF